MSSNVAGPLLGLAGAVAAVGAGLGLLSDTDACDGGALPIRPGAVAADAVWFMGGRGCAEPTPEGRGSCGGYCC